MESCRMEKPAQTEHPILDLLARRWSPRAFADRRVEPEKLRRLFEAARWSASSFNEQPWRFILATKDDPREYARLLGCLIEKNQAWAVHAPVLMLGLTRTHFTKTGKPNRVHEHDLGLAMGNLTIQAMAMDLWVHQMAGIDPDQARTTYSVPDDFTILTACAIGYMGDPDILPEGLREAERSTRSREPLDEFVFARTFGEPGLTSGATPSGMP